MPPTAGGGGCCSHAARQRNAPGLIGRSWREASLTEACLDHRGVRAELARQHQVEQVWPLAFQSSEGGGGTISGRLETVDIVLSVVNGFLAVLPGGGSGCKLASKST
jgi:hypothetical protein